MHTVTNISLSARQFWPKIMIFTVEYNMYTVYCYAYYLTIKGTKVGNSGLCVTTRERISSFLAYWKLHFWLGRYWIESGMLIIGFSLGSAAYLFIIYFIPFLLQSRAFKQNFACPNIFVKGTVAVTVALFPFCGNLLYWNNHPWWLHIPHHID